MKKYLIIFIACIARFGLVSFKNFNNRVDEMFKALGISPNHAKEHIWKSFAGSFFSIPANTSIKNMSVNKRIAVINEIGIYVRNYLFSSEFNHQYQLFREQKRPKTPASVVERIQNQIAEYSRLLKESQESMRKASPELRSLFETSVANYKQNISALENDYDPQHNSQIEGILIQHEYDLGDYRFRTKQFEKEFPADVKAFIKLRLQEFIHIATTVDLNADLVEKNGVKIFANRAYETKPTAWKYCFRAGKESTRAARNLAEQWIKEI